MKMLSGLGHPSFKSLAAYKNNKNVTDSFSKFFFPSKGPTEDIISLALLMQFVGVANGLIVFRVMTIDPLLSPSGCFMPNC